MPAVSVPAKLLEFSYDGLSRRTRKKVQEKPAGSSTWSIVKWEAYVYDGWNMVMAVNLNPTAGGSYGKAQSLVASYVWGPDIGSPVTARSDWQRAGGVGGLLMAVYPVAATGSVPTFEQWMTSEGYNPLPQEGSNEWENALWTYESIWGSNVNVHVPVMDHMGNVLGVTRLAATPGSGGTATSEYVYDYDAFGKEMRSSSLVANGNPDSFPFHYSTKFTDGETGLNYYGYRYLDTQRGRWINRDPIGERGGVNLYGMVGNDAIGMVDVIGMAGVIDLKFIREKGVSEKRQKANADRYTKALEEAIQFCCDSFAIGCDVAVRKTIDPVARNFKNSGRDANHYKNLTEALGQESKDGTVPVIDLNNAVPAGPDRVVAGRGLPGAGVLVGRTGLADDQTLAHEIGHVAGYRAPEGEEFVDANGSKVPTHSGKADNLMADAAISEGSKRKPDRCWCSAMVALGKRKK